MESREQAKEKTRKYIQNSIVSYIWQEPFRTLPWIRKEIQKSGISSPDLKRAFRNLVKEYGDHKRFRTLFDICRNAHFNCLLVE
jgi:hypothetical protein